MAAPTVTATLDKTTYKSGDPVVLTVNYSGTGAGSVTVTVQVTNADGTAAAPVVVTSALNVPTIAVSDSAGRTWSKQSDSGSVAVYKTTA